ncbi:hypothetical protein DICVIV_00103 [Dictyocaulus viviparus]|uniref:Uncharacterized protein n=1 Tax=Dictyocaulus viviparus TaxID=29172 RepID=A0A0D8YAC1_DICVI|nr:hypothetical protein DICVIV_00103 [Dictyocaulus viviparus]
MTFALVILGNVLARIISRCPIPRANCNLCMTVRDSDIRFVEDNRQICQHNINDNLKSSDGRGLRKMTSKEIFNMFRENDDIYDAVEVSIRRLMLDEKPNANLPIRPDNDLISGSSSTSCETAIEELTEESITS